MAGKSWPGRLRQFLVGVLAIVTCLVVLAAGVGFWVNRNFLKTDVWVDRVGPLAEDPAVQDALTRKLTAELMGLIDPASLFSQALPDRGQILAVPLAGAVERFVSDQVRAFLQSDTFSQLWVGLNERAHEQAVSALRGESPLVEAREREVVINLVPVVNGLVKQIQSISPGLFGRQVEVPELSAGVLPDEARQRLAGALGIELPDNFGAVTVYDRGALRAAQTAVQAFDKFFALAVGLSAVLVLLTFWLSRRRRRTGLQMIFGVALGLVLVRRAAFWVEEDVLSQVREANRGVAQAVLRAFLDPLILGSALLFVVLAVVAIGLVLTGPYPWAVTMRARLLVAGSGAAPGEPVTRWVQEQRELLQIAGPIVFVIGILMFDVSWPGLFVLLGLLVVYELAVLRAAGPPPEKPAAGTPAGHTVTPGG